MVATCLLHVLTLRLLVQVVVMLAPLAITIALNVRPILRYGYQAAFADCITTITEVARSG